MYLVLCKSEREGTGDGAGLARPIQKQGPCHPGMLHKALSPFKLIDGADFTEVDGWIDGVWV
jgi:hypothetical protein